MQFSTPAAARRLTTSATLLVATLLAGCFNLGLGDDSTPTPTPTATAAPATATAEPTPSVVWPSLGTATITTDDLNVRTGPGGDHVVRGRLQPGDEVPVSGRASNGRWLALTGIGWVAYDETWMELSLPLDDLPLISQEEAGFEFVGPLHPPTTRVDIPVVDIVVDAVLEGDRETLLALGRVDESEPEATAGATVDPTIGPAEPRRPPNHICAESIVPGNELDAFIDDFLTSEVVEDGQLRLYSVTGAGALAGDDPDALFVVLFAFEGGEARQMWLAPDGSGIVWFSLGCRPMPPADLLRVPRGPEPFFWLYPPLPEPLDPVQ